jgi:hypothetical protein
VNGDALQSLAKPQAVRLEQHLRDVVVDVAG